MIPDLHVHRVVREGAEPGWVAGIEAMQPDETGIWHLTVSDRPFDAFSRSGPRVCRWDGDAWRDEGLVPEIDDPSVHPDVRGGCADYVRIARRVLDAIPRGLNVTVELVSSRTGDTDSVTALTTFNCIGDVSDGVPVHVADEILDRVPGVRHLERVGSDFASMFGIESYDDGSGYPGEFKLSVSKDALLVSYEEPNSGATMVVESEMQDGAWRHWTILKATETITDGMDTLRRLTDDSFALSSIFDECEEENPMAVLLGIGLESQVRVLEVARDDEAAGPISFMLEPGGLR